MEDDLNFKEMEDDLNLSTTKKKTEIQADLNLKEF